jgi:hypothetical protein
MSALFKGKLLAYFKAAVASGDIKCIGTLEQFNSPVALKALLDTLYKLSWVVYAKPPFAGPKAVLKYLGRYTHRIAISNSRIAAITDKTVSFAWKDYADGNKQKTMTLSKTEFIRRFMLHVVPNGFVRIRHYGFLSNRSRKEKLDRCMVLLGTPPVKDNSPEKEKQAGHWYDLIMQLTGKDPTLCPVCAVGHLKTCRELPRGFPAQSAGVVAA